MIILNKDLAIQMEIRSIQPVIAGKTTSVSSASPWFALTRFTLLSLLFLGFAGKRHAIAIDIQFDYSYDTSGFFNNTTARSTLEEAAAVFEVFTDTLSPILPSGTSQWDANFTNPSTGNSSSIHNLSVQADTLIIYAGGRNLGSTSLGQGGPGGWGGSGTQNWLNILWGRGEGTGTSTAVSGSTAYEFGPWGGSLSFDTLTPNGSTRNWHYDTSTEPSSGENDFFSVAVHELGHALGFGTSQSFMNLVVADGFNGTLARGLNNGNSIPLDGNNSHWANGTTSPPTDSSGPETAMDPSITQGTRKGFTALDFAALSDIGWDVPTSLLVDPISTGDFDSDGDVDGDDFLAWQVGFGTTSGATLLHGDGNGSGSVNAIDFTIWSEQYGTTGGNAGGNLFGAAVPEPGSILLFIISGAFAALQWKRSIF